jgi:hypothetical protein
VSGDGACGDPRQGAAPPFLGYGVLYALPVAIWSSQRLVLKETTLLSCPIVMRDRTKLAGAGSFILALPKAYQHRNSSLKATELLMEAAEWNGDIEAATEAVSARASCSLCGCREGTMRAR